MWNKNTDEYMQTFEYTTTNIFIKLPKKMLFYLNIGGKLCGGRFPVEVSSIYISNTAKGVFVCSRFLTILLSFL